MRRLFKLTTDLERRAALQLAHLRRLPKIRTPCCGCEMCFKCKITGHHEGFTCEEMQQKELELEVQFCPGCDVPTQRTEGCDHMVCLCGENWTWQGDGTVHEEEEEEE